MKLLIDKFLDGLWFWEFSMFISSLKASTHGDRGLSMSLVFSHSSSTSSLLIDGLVKSVTIPQRRPLMQIDTRFPVSIGKSFPVLLWRCLQITLHHRYLQMTAKIWDRKHSHPRHQRSYLQLLFWTRWLPRPPGRRWIQSKHQQSNMSIPSSSSLPSQTDIVVWWGMCR